MIKFRNINAPLPAIDVERATDSELVIYLGLLGLKVFSPSPGKFNMAYKSKQFPLSAGLFSNALKEAASLFSKGNLK